MAVGAVYEFLAVLERSKLLKPEEFAEASLLAKDISDPTSLAKALVRQNKLTRWQAGQLLAGRSTVFLGKYKLLEMLGKGGMGSVFLGEHVMMNRRVALKIIPRHIGKDPAGLERFLAEARTIASLDHPNVVQAYSVDNEGDIYYLVMEYVEGLDLQRLIEAEGPLDCASAVDYVRQAADGLAHSHTRKMIHCDIKPSNLIVNPNGVVKILDMGLARLSGHEQVEGGASELDERILGSVDYMAPEQALRTADFDHRADIYSLGCTLYFLLTGHAPFPEGTLPERILKHQNQEPKPISTERSDVPLSLIEICKKMMAKRPALRYQTMAEVSQVLAAWRPGEKRVQRVLQLKKAEPVDELPGPNLLGMNLSDLIQTGIGVPTTTPLKIRKHPLTRVEKIRTVLSSLVSTPLRMISTIGVAALVVVLLVALLILPFGQNNGLPTNPEKGPVAPNDTTPNNVVNPPPGVGKAKPEDNGNQKAPSPTTTPPAPVEPVKETESAVPATPPEKPIENEVGGTEPAKSNEITEEKTKEEEPKIEPLKDLAADVDLPEIPKPGKDENAAKATASLGKVLLPPGDSLQLVLIGGDKAVKGIDSLVIQNNTTAQQSPFWQIYLETAPKENTDPSQRIEIARLNLIAGNLEFNWTSDAAPAHADALRLCGILAFVQEQQKFVQLCRPRQVKPLLLDLDKGVAEISLPLESQPEARNLKVQITDRENISSPNTLTPSDIIEVQSEEKNIIKMVFTQGNLSNFWIEFTAKIRGQKLDLKATAIYEIPGLQKLKIFKALEAEQLPAKYSNLQNTLQAPAQANKLEQVKKAILFLQDLGGLYPNLNKQGKIHYSVYILLYGKYKVELFTTQAPAAETAESKDANQSSADKTDVDSQSKKPPPKRTKKKP